MSRPLVGTTYLVHFAQPIGAPDNPRGQAQHYIGWTEDVEARLDRHTNGQGARILAACVAKGIGFKVVRTWPRTTKATERKLKKRKCARRLCPVCS